MYYLLSNIFLCITYTLCTRFRVFACFQAAALLITISILSVIAMITGCITNHCQVKLLDNKHSASPV